MMRSLILFGLLGLAACQDRQEAAAPSSDTLTHVDSLQALARQVEQLRADSLRLADSLRRIDSVRVADSLLRLRDSLPALAVGKTIDTKGAHPKDVVFFAKTLIGVPYKYASSDPKTGFDCSGFITYVFGRFRIVVPRSSKEFTDKGREISPGTARPGDLVLFTGTDSTEQFVGHMGLVVANDGKQLEFIHSTSGKAHGVTITPLNDYYKSRYVKTIRIFPEEKFR